MKDTIIVLGGDGYYGWPIALKLAVTHRDTKILIVDNEWRRNTVKKIGSDSLTPIATLPQRIEAYRKIYQNNNLQFVYLDVNSDALDQLIEQEQPHTIYHMAQQCSAPYSMLGLNESLYTIQNNEGNNMRLLWAVRKHVPDAHIIKMGSMGEYATSGGIDIAEGYFFPEFNGKKAVSPLPFPRQSDDVYHISKINDSNYISMAARKWGLRITEVMQSTLFGVYTEEMKDCPELFTRFDYDDIFGTVVNRFLTQAVAGHPLTVYGKGNQTTGIMPMKDAVRSLEMIAGTLPAKGEHKVVNHVTKANCTINELAEAVKQIAAAKGYDVTINHVFDPRSESAAVKHDIKVMADHIEDNLATTPINEVLAETFNIIEAQQQRINAKAFTHHIHAFEGKYETEEANTPAADIATDERKWISFREQEFSNRRFNLNPGTLGNTSKSVQSVRQRTEVQEQLQGNPLGAYEFSRNCLAEIRQLEKNIWPSQGYELVVGNAASQMTNLLALSLIRAHQATAEQPLRVITSANEHPGGIGVFEQLPEFKVYYLRDEVLQNRNQLLDAVIDIKPNIAFLSQVFYATGNTSDHETFCNLISQTTPNCTIILDVTQAIGLYDLPFGKADVLVGSLHKWMFGPQGSGLAWMKPKFMKQIGGLYWNGLGDDSSLAAFNVQGGQDFGIYAEVLEALKLYQKVGKDVVLQRSRYLAGVFCDELSAALDAAEIHHTIVSQQHDSPLLSFGFIDFHPYDLYRELNEKGVHCKCIIDYSGGKKYRHILRFGIPYFETVERMHQAVSMIADVVAQQKKVLQLHPQQTETNEKVKQLAA